MKKLTIDIETSPNLAYVWGLWDQNVGLNQIESVGSVICFAAKWHGSKKVVYYSDHHDGHDVMVKEAWELMSEADALIHYNGKAFDVKHLQREFLLAGLGPAAPHIDIDLLAVARRQFKFPSNKLQHVSDALGLGGKLQHTGFDLWRDCMMGDDKAWAMMKKYNIQDVRLTEKLYDRLLPWIPNHPNEALFMQDPDACPQCGGKGTLISNGVRANRTMTYRRFFCTSCGAWPRERMGSKQAKPNFV
jgi:hypothetical protein